MNVNSDTPHNYVYTQSESKNLVALYHARAKRVLLNADKHTVGIEYQVRRLAYKPHSTSYVMLRTVFLSFGRFGYVSSSYVCLYFHSLNYCIVPCFCVGGGSRWGAASTPSLGAEAGLRNGARVARYRSRSPPKHVAES
jgi:hypothetical protein